jgi:hypothetical protein
MFRDQIPVPGGVPVTPEHNRTAEHAQECAHCLQNITGIDEHCQSRSQSGTPHHQGGPIAQPVFQHADDAFQNQLLAGLNVHIEHALIPGIPATPVNPPQGDDPFQMIVDPQLNNTVAAQQPGLININYVNSLPVRNAPLHAMEQNVGPLSQEGQFFK